MIDRRFGIDELGEVFGSEVADALEMGRFLESSVDATTRAMPGLGTGYDAATEARGGLSDRVMAVLASEPAPAPAGFLLPLRRTGFLTGLWASFRQASVATRGAGRPLLARGAALAYVLVLAIAGLSLTGLATIGAAGALGLLGPAASEAPPTVAPPATPLVSPPPTVAPPIASPNSTPTRTATPSPSPSPTESDDSPEASDDNGGNSGPGGGGDDNSGPGGGGGDNSGPGSSGSGSGSGSGSDSGSDSGSSGQGSGSD